MTDPRQEDRERGPVFYRELTHPQQLDRIKLRLSPADDGLPTPQAIRHNEEMKQAAASYRKLRRKHVEEAAPYRPSGTDALAGTRPPDGGTVPDSSTLVENVEAGRVPRERKQGRDYHGDPGATPASSTLVENVEGGVPGGALPATAGDTSRPSTPTENE